MTNDPSQEGFQVPDPVACLLTCFPDMTQAQAALVVEALTANELLRQTPNDWVSIPEGCIALADIRCTEFIDPSKPDYAGTFTVVRNANDTAPITASIGLLVTSALDLWAKARGLGT